MQFLSGNLRASDVVVGQREGEFPAPQEGGVPVLGALRVPIGCGIAEGHVAHILEVGHHTAIGVGLGIGGAQGRHDVVEGAFEFQASRGLKLRGREERSQGCLDVALALGEGAGDGIDGRGRRLIRNKTDAKFGSADEARRAWMPGHDVDERGRGRLHRDRPGCRARAPASRRCRALLRGRRPSRGP